LHEQEAKEKAMAEEKKSDEKDMFNSHKKKEIICCSFLKPVNIKRAQG